MRHRLGHAQHAIERRADFVAHVGEEFGLYRGGGLGAVARRLQEHVGLQELYLGLLERGDIARQHVKAERPPRRIDVGNIAGQGMADCAGRPCQGSLERLGLAVQSGADTPFAPGELLRPQKLRQGHVQDVLRIAAEPLLVGRVGELAVKLGVPISYQSRQIVGHRANKPLRLDVPG